MAITGYPNFTNLPPELQVQFKLVWDALIGMQTADPAEIAEALERLQELADTIETMQQFQQQLLQFKATMEAFQSEMLARMINTTAPLSGGGDLSADRTLELDIYAARVRRTTNQTLTTTTFTPLSFDAERWDYGGFWAVGQPTRLVAPIAGWYHIGGCVSFAANATGPRIIAIRLNGAGAGYSRVQDTPNVAATETFGTTADIYLNATDYVELMAQQNSGGDLDVVSAAQYSPEFWMHLTGTGV